MSDIYWVIAANVVVWVGLGSYCIYMACVQKGLEKRLRHMEIMDNAG